MYERNCKAMINVGRRILSYLEWQKVVPEEELPSEFLFKMLPGIECCFLFTFKVIGILNSVLSAPLELFFIHRNLST